MTIDNNIDHDKLNSNENLIVNKFSLKDFTYHYLPALISSFEKNDVSIDTAIIFGSAVHPEPNSDSVKTNPPRWDVDLLLLSGSLEKLRKNPQTLIKTSDQTYGLIIPPSGEVAEMQEINAMDINDPKYGFHIQLVETDSFLNENFDSMTKKAFETGVIVDGEIPSSLKMILEKNKIIPPKHDSDTTNWSSLTTAISQKSNRII